METRRLSSERCGSDPSARWVRLSAEAPPDPVSGTARFSPRVYLTAKKRSRCHSPRVQARLRQNPWIWLPHPRRQTQQAFGGPVDVGGQAQAGLLRQAVRLDLRLPSSYCWPPRTRIAARGRLPFEIRYPMIQKAPTTETRRWGLGIALTLVAVVSGSTIFGFR